MSMIESIRSFFCACPYLADGKMSVDYLGADPTGYTIDAVPSSGIVKQYTDGGTLRQFVFVFASREYYGESVLRQLTNIGFYENLARWIEEQSEAGNLPKPGEGFAPQKMEILSTGYLFDAEEKNARYQMQCRLIYYEKRKT